MNILRTIGAVFLGIIMCGMVVFTLEYTSHRLFPISEEATKALSSPEAIAKLKEQDPAKLVELMESLPLSAKLAVVVGWACGVFVGALLAARVSRNHPIVAALSIGVVQTLAVLMTLTMIPHPIWMAVAGLGTQLPPAYLAGRIVRGKLAALPAR